MVVVLSCGRGEREREREMKREEREIGERGHTSYLNGGITIAYLLVTLVDFLDRSDNL